MEVEQASGNGKGHVKTAANVGLAIENGSTGMVGGGEALGGDPGHVASSSAPGGEAAEALRGEHETPGSMTGEAAPMPPGGFALDAWYAEFGDARFVETLRRRADLAEAFFAEVVIGRDDRVQVTATTTFPWRAIAYLDITAADGSRWMGTGWFISPRTVMTAGHCVFMKSHGGWAKSIRVIPGRNAASEPYASATGTYFHSVKGWTDSNNRDYDYGCIVLPPSGALGNKVGWFGFAALNDASLDELFVNLSGYPGDKPSGTQWFHARSIKDVDDRVLTYDIDTAGGQSGSPVWRLKSGERHAVGIHTNGASSGNSATRITMPVYTNMLAWKTEGS